MIYYGFVLRHNILYFVGIDETGIVNTVLASVFHDKLQNTTLLQHHWAGRGTRGAAQFNGKTINELLYDEQFENNINDNESKSFLQKLLNRYNNAVLQAYNSTITQARSPPKYGTSGLSFQIVRLLFIR